MTRTVDNGPKDGTMESRVDDAKTAPEVGAAMMGLERYVHQTGLDRGLLELVKLRASLINGCAYCVDMHTKVARARDETEQRLYAVSLWRETPFSIRAVGLRKGPPPGQH
jgi:AhpD family alkylhydroperoxidase